MVLGNPSLATDHTHNDGNCYTIWLQV
uniref:Uncharacterized protein n=1 Tax=Arundo donax TaxID=35708 RepID=A0A0A8XXT6_ARUDO